MRIQHLPLISVGGVQVWRRWLERAGPALGSTQIFYDVDCSWGCAPVGLSELDRPLAERHEIVRRIDVVIQAGTTSWVVVPRREAGMGVMGQVLGYCRLVQQNLPQFENPRAAILCEKCDAELKELLDFFKVTVWLCEEGTLLAKL